MRKCYEVRIRNNVKEIAIHVSLTTDAWSSRIYKGYISIKLAWMDKKWCLHNVLVDFVYFPTPHNIEKTSNLLFELSSHWHLIEKSKM